MRYHIDTIPVWDAYREDSECPLCGLEARSEQTYVEQFLGASVMEPDMRVEVNEKGFCGPHFDLMLGQKNRLGLALMTHTHLQHTLHTLQAPQKKKKPLLGKRDAAPDAPGETCILCERLRGTMQRYLYTTLHLYRTEEGFRPLLEGGKGHCLPHYQALADMVLSEWGAARAAPLTAMLERVQRDNMARIEQELDWFTRKFDYRNAGEPWGNARDALERAIRKLRGR